MLRQRRGQSIIEYTVIAILVILGIVVMGPYVLRSVNSHFKIWDDQVQDSFNDKLKQAPANSVTLPPGCSCSDSFVMSSCGPVNGKTRNCAPNERYGYKTCAPGASCSASCITECSLNETCVLDTTCCFYERGNCGNESRVNIPTPRGTVAGTIEGQTIMAPVGGKCFFNEREVKSHCGGAIAPVYGCMQDTTADDDDDSCAAQCQGAVPPHATLCPDTTINLLDNTPLTVSGTEPASCPPAGNVLQKCKYHCDTNFIVQGNSCIRQCYHQWSGFYHNSYPNYVYLTQGSFSNYNINGTSLDVYNPLKIYSAANAQSTLSTNPSIINSLPLLSPGYSRGTRFVFNVAQLNSEDQATQNDFIANLSATNAFVANRYLCASGVVGEDTTLGTCHRNGSGADTPVFKINGKILVSSTDDNQGVYFREATAIGPFSVPDDSCAYCVCDTTASGRQCNTTISDTPPAVSANTYTGPCQYSNFGYSFGCGKKRCPTYTYSFLTGMGDQYLCYISSQSVGNGDSLGALIYNSTTKEWSISGNDTKGGDPIQLSVNIECIKKTTTTP